MITLSLLGFQFNILYIQIMEEIIPLEQPELIVLRELFLHCIPELKCKAEKNEEINDQ